MTKISVYIDDAVWKEFKQQVFQKHETLKKLSSEVEEIIRESNIETEVIRGFEKIGAKAKGTISSQEIEAKRPKLKGPPAKTILEQMRKQKS